MVCISRWLSNEIATKADFEISWYYNSYGTPPKLNEENCYQPVSIQLLKQIYYKMRGKSIFRIDISRISGKWIRLLKNNCPWKSWIYHRLLCPYSEYVSWLGVPRLAHRICGIQLFELFLGFMVPLSRKVAYDRSTYYLRRALSFSFPRGHTWMWVA